nr:nuclear prelamin A recognition factor isoform X2 [Caretta caretta]
MKCENCTKKECSKKQKNDDKQNTSVDPLSTNDENEEKSEFHKLASAKIFLSDCLACDNCVTSEEGVRIFQQNQKELFRILNLNKKCDTSKHKVLAVSICPQSLPYFAAKFNLCVNDAAKRLCGFLKSLGVHYVFDTTIAADFSILESQKEFVQRYRQRNQEEHALPMFASACPGEIVQIMEQKNISMKEVAEVAIDSLFGEIKEEDLVRHDGRRSDGYLEHIFKHAAKELFDMDIKEITYKTLKNKDFQEVTLEKDGETVLRFAAAYGFRNIQNVVLKLKKGKFLYHFVEVLACPGGCLNGKGQAQTEDGKPDKVLLSQMEEVYAAIPVRLPETSMHVQKLYQDWLEGMDSKKVQETLHTKYCAVNQTASSMDIKW